MISAVLFLSFFVFLIMGIPISICLGLSCVRDPVLWYILNHRCHQYVLRYQ